MTPWGPHLSSSHNSRPAWFSFQVEKWLLGASNSTQVLNLPRCFPSVAPPAPGWGRGRPMDSEVANRPGSARRVPATAGWRWGQLWEGEGLAWVQGEMGKACQSSEALKEPPILPPGRPRDKAGRGSFLSPEPSAGPLGTGQEKMGWGGSEAFLPTPCCAGLLCWGGATPRGLASLGQRVRLRVTPILRSALFHLASCLWGHWLSGHAPRAPLGFLAAVQCWCSAWAGYL